MTTRTKMSRIRLVLVAAAALGSSSAVLSGTLAALDANTTLPRSQTIA
ncbi:MAG TPA: hypothetical protein VGB62_03900 [Allosphingosinicella sp.]|jgi:hypothetical protein